MSDRRYEQHLWTLFCFDEPTLGLAERETKVLAAIMEEAHRQAYDKPVTDPDSCQCLALRSFAALDRFFESGGYDVASAMALARDRKQNRCANCLRREQETASAR